MGEIRRSHLDWARDIARAYRAALRAIAPEKCAELDELARARGQRWIAPVIVLPGALEEAMDKPLTPQQIEQLLEIPASTVRSWARPSRRDPDDPTKPLLARHDGPDGRPLYVPREVIAVQARHRRGGHLRAAAGQ
jgi:hypothetical protein